MLACPVLWSQALPGADDLFGSGSSARGRPVLLVLVLRLDGVDAALRRDVDFDLKETAQRDLLFSGCWRARIHQDAENDSLFHLLLHGGIT